MSREIKQPCRTPTSTSKKYDFFSYVSTQLRVWEYIFLISLLILPQTSSSHNVFHKHVRQILPYAFRISIKQQNVLESICLFRILISINIWSTHPLPGRNPLSSFIIISLASLQSITIKFKIQMYNLLPILRKEIPRWLFGSLLFPSEEIVKIIPFIQLSGICSYSKHFLHKIHTSLQTCSPPYLIIFPTIQSIPTAFPRLIFLIASTISLYDIMLLGLFSPMISSVLSNNSTSALTSSLNFSSNASFISDYIISFSKASFLKHLRCFSI